MEAPGESTIRAAEERVVSGALMNELHEANAQFHQCKQLVEQTMADHEDQHLERVRQATQRLLEAERRVEEINRKIHESLKPPPAQQTGK